MPSTSELHIPPPRKLRRARSALFLAAFAVLLLTVEPTIAAFPAARANPAPASAASVAPPNWTRLAPSATPGNLSEFAFAWLSNGSHSYGLLFGGRQGPTNLSAGTWTYAKGQWTALPLAIHPSARRGAMMAYDTRDGYFVLFGGSDKTAYLNDTWSFSAGKWTDLNLTRAPMPRRVGGFAYDISAGYGLLFGGHRGGLNGSYTDVSDTWKFTGGHWYRLRPSAAPSPRSELSESYDAAARTIVVFGGKSHTSHHYIAFNDTWCWAKGNWHALPGPKAPPARDGAAFAYDARAKAEILQGGHFDSGNASAVEYNDTWLLTGNSGATLSWSRAAVGRAPPPTDASGMIYDTSRRVLVMFGGRTGVPAPTWFDATWTLSYP